MDFVGKRGWFFLISAIVVMVSIVSLLLPDGLNAGLEFTGGSSMTLEFQEDPGQERLRSELANLDHADAVIQRLGEGVFFVRTRTLEEAQSGGSSEKERIVAALEDSLGSRIESSDFFSVSPSIAWRSRDAWHWELPGDGEKPRLLPPRSRRKTCHNSRECLQISGQVSGLAVSFGFFRWTAQRESRTCIKDKCGLSNPGSYPFALLLVSGFRGFFLSFESRFRILHELILTTPRP